MNDEFWVRGGMWQRRLNRKQLFYEALIRARWREALHYLYEMFVLFILRVARRNLNIPKHIAFIMDGNRRFAKKFGIEQIQGHSSGFDALVKVLEWCLELNVKTVTVFAFSIQNFSRSQEEVEGLMELAAEKFQEFSNEKSFVMQNKIRVRVIGDLDLLSPRLKHIVSELMLETELNDNATLNICFPYTSTEEMATTAKHLIMGLRMRQLEPCDITEQYFARCLYTRENAYPEIVVRTSGEIRLSDFLIWQSRYSCICFLQVLWPQISVWHLLWCIAKFQYQLMIDAKLHTLNSTGFSFALAHRQAKFLSRIEEEERNKLLFWRQAKSL